ELVVLLWHTKIDDTEVDLAHLRHMIEDFLNVTAPCTPSILISKPKFHFLVHLPMYIQQFGPAIILCIHSNQQALSWDSCHKFAQLNLIKHIISGGYWYGHSV
ncbi:hypothetical protein PAXRUDRAFT_160208, partial [Paxillus rubicundulus Ve08.2h10]